MKHKTAELEGALLDAAVAKALGARVYRLEAVAGSHWRAKGGDVRPETATPGGPLISYMAQQFSSNWALGGPIIERERIGLLPPVEGVTLLWATSGFKRYAQGETALIAAMRAYVASKFGDEVEL